LRITAISLAIAVTAIGGSVAAQNAVTPDTVKIGIVVPMTGTSAAVGREISDATKLYVAQHGDTVAGRKI
jgi:branched-chain amino acid transport system substrate-binding protein